MSFRAQDLDHIGARRPPARNHRGGDRHDHPHQRYRDQLPVRINAIRRGRNVRAAYIADEVEQQPAQPTPTGTPATLPSNARNPADAVTIPITWRGLMPSALRVAVSRTRSRVFSSTVLKMPATAISAMTAAIANRMTSIDVSEPAPLLLARTSKQLRPSGGQTLHVGADVITGLEGDQIGRCEVRPGTAAESVDQSSMSSWPPGPPSEVVDLAHEPQLQAAPPANRSSECIADLEVGVLEQPPGRHHLARTAEPAARGQQVAERLRVTAKDR